MENPLTRILRFESLARGDLKRRRQLIEALVMGVKPHHLKLHTSLIYSSPFKEFVFPEDVPFLLEMLARETNVTRQTVLTQLVVDAWSRGQKQEEEWHRNLNCIFATWRASSNGSESKIKPFQNYFDPWLLAVEVRSARADELRSIAQQQLEQDQEWQWRRQEQEKKQQQWDRKKGPSPLKLINETLVDYDSGQLTVGRAWRKIEYYLCFNENGRGQCDPARADLASQPGWKALPDHSRQRVAEIAKSYVTATDEETLSAIHDPKMASLPSGYRALRLLLEIEPEWVEQLQPQAWTRWAPSIAFFPDWHERETRAERAYLTKLALKYAAPEFLQAFSSVIDLENTPEGLRCLDRLILLWQPGDEVAQMLMLKAQDPALLEVPLRQLLSLLIKKGDHATEAWARSVVVTPPPVSDPERMQARIAAEVLMNETIDGGYPQVFPAFQSDPEFGRSVIEHVAHYWFMPQEEQKPNLGEKELADLYLWLTREFPPQDDEPREGFQSVTTRYQIAQMREGVLGQLASRKTEAGCRELERIVQAVPTNANLKWMLQSARERWRRATWTPMTIKNALQIGNDVMSHPTIAIVTALDKEFAAMSVLLEDSKRWKAPNSGGSGTYELGRISASNGGEHGVVLALLPDMGNNLSGVVTAGLLRDLSSVRHVVMCGIAGGVPAPDVVENHVRLGDIVTSGRGGVIQYDFGKINPGDLFEHNPAPRPPAASLLHAYRLLSADVLQGKRPWIKHIEQACEKLNAHRPDPMTDQLLASTQRRRIIPHPQDLGSQPRVFNGSIASANAVLKDPKKRDELRDRFSVRAVEMEGSGIADAVWEWEKAGYFIIRGICDYCDKRNKGELGQHWQLYAAIIAAGFTRALIESIVIEQPLNSPDPNNII